MTDEPNLQVLCPVCREKVDGLADALMGISKRQGGRLLTESEARRMAYEIIAEFVDDMDNRHGASDD